jgi:hypothetical protein
MGRGLKVLNIVRITTIGGFYKQFMKKYLVLVLLVCGCKGMPFMAGLPTRHNYVNSPPPGPKDFQYGWMGGCYTGAQGQIPQFYNDLGFIYPHKDYQFAKDHPDYELGWQTALWYCVRVGERFEGLSKDKYGGII